LTRRSRYVQIHGIFGLGPAAVHQYVAHLLCWRAWETARAALVADRAGTTSWAVVRVSRRQWCAALRCRRPGATVGSCKRDSRRPVARIVSNSCNRPRDSGHRPWRTPIVPRRPRTPRASAQENNYNMIIINCNSQVMYAQWRVELHFWWGANIYTSHPPCPSYHSISI